MIDAKLIFFYQIPIRIRNFRTGIGIELRKMLRVDFFQNR
jgi:hypothetical protein